MESYTIALFGEAERGEYRTAYYCESIGELLEHLGNPPPESRGIFYAIQALLYHHSLIFFRVREEGFSCQDYLLGLHQLEKTKVDSQLGAICLPGVGDVAIIEAIAPICEVHHSILITNESDFYDYVSELKSG